MSSKKLKFPKQKRFGSFVVGTQTVSHTSDIFLNNI